MSSDHFDDYTGVATVPSSYERVIGYTVQDKAGRDVGKVHNLWIDDQGQPLFLGVKTGWLFGKNHVVPISQADVNDHRRLIRLPFSEEQIKHAPTFEDNADIADYDQDRIFTYYGVEPSSGSVPLTQEKLTRELSREGPRTAEAPVSIREERMDTPSAANLEPDRTIQLKEEQVKVGKRQVEAGGIRLRKIVRTETVNQPIQLQREEIVIERVPGGDAPAAGEKFGAEDIFIPLRREEPVVQKDARVTEEVHVGKKIDVERKEVTAEVRKEELEVDDSTRRRPSI